MLKCTHLHVNVHVFVPVTLVCSVKGVVVTGSHSASVSGADDVIIGAECGVDSE